MENTKDLFGVVALAFNITQIDTILGILLTIINLIIVLTNYGCKIYNKIKNRDIKGIIEDTEELKDKIEKVKEDIENADK